jgi:antitoxin ParD1/3/4
MTVAVDPKWEPLLRRLVEEGRYSSPEAALDDALCYLEERAAKFQRLKHDIEIGLNSGPGSAASFAEIAERARAKWEQEQQAEDALKQRSAAE